MRHLPAVVLAFAAAGCSTAPMPVAAGCPAGTRPGVITTLYLGRGPDARTVGDAAMRDFLDHEVVPRFPGFTMVDAAGAWRGAMESTELLLIGHAGDPRALAQVDAVAAAYARRFAQELIGRSDQRVCQNFA